MIFDILYVISVFKDKNRKSGFVTFDVPEKQRLSTEEDDVIGW
jgi:hypothetical protein